jgi:hypothetical protein
MQLRSNSSSVVIWLMATCPIVILMEPWCRIRTNRHLLATLPLLRIPNNSSRSRLLRCTWWCAMSIGTAVLVYRASNGCFFAGRRRDGHLLLNRERNARQDLWAKLQQILPHAEVRKYLAITLTLLLIVSWNCLSNLIPAQWGKKMTLMFSLLEHAPNKEPVMPEMSSQAMHEWNIPCAAAARRSRRIEAKPTEVLIFACVRL